MNWIATAQIVARWRVGAALAAASPVRDLGPRVVDRNVKPENVSAAPERPRPRALLLEAVVLTRGELLGTFTVARCASVRNAALVRATV